MATAASTRQRRFRSLFATPAIVAERRADGSTVAEIDHALAAKRALRRRLAGALGAAGAGPHLPGDRPSADAPWTTVTTAMR